MSRYIARSARSFDQRFPAVAVRSAFNGLGASFRNQQLGVSIRYVQNIADAIFREIHVVYALCEFFYEPDNQY